jgi:peptidyl-prolyl cis-trans isomerase D
MAAFQRQGSFDRQVYQQLLSMNRVTPAAFEHDVRDDLLLKRLNQIVALGGVVPTPEIAAAVARAGERIAVSFVKVDPQQFTGEVTVSDEALATFYAANKETFREPERRRIAAVVVDAADLMAEVKVAEADIETYYNDHQIDYFVPEEVKASHILIKVEEKDPPKVWEQAREEALALLLRIQQGEDFATLAKEYSDCPSASRGGDLGWFKRGMMVKAFEDAAFALKPGTVTSEPVRTPFGYHLIQVADHRQSRTKELAEVRDEIITALTNEKLPDLVKARLDRIQAELAGVSPEGFAERAGAKAVKLVQSGWFARDEEIGGIGRDPKLAEKAFAAEVGTLQRLVNPKGPSYLFMVTEVRETYIPPLDDKLRPRVATAYKLHEARVLAQQKGSAMIAALKAGQPFAEVAKENNLKVEETPLFARAGGFIPKLGVDAKLSRRLFSLDADHPVYPEPLEYQGAYLIVRLEKREFDETKAGPDVKERAELQAAGYRRYQRLEDFANMLRRDAEIEISPELFES